MTDNTQVQQLLDVEAPRPMPEIGAWCIARIRLERLRLERLRVDPLGAPLARQA